MTARVAFVVLVLFMGLARAEIPPAADDLSKAYDAALAELRAGKDRQSIADRLKPVVEKYPTSNYASVAGPFLVDLAASAKKAPAQPGDPLEKRLADTRVPLHLLRYAENWEEALKAFLAQEPHDPAVQLVVADRAVIARLIPLLADRAPTRLNNSNPFGRITLQPRVCDLALALIEYHGKVRFHQTENTGSRSVEGRAQSFSYVDTACELLQKQVGKDFGYRLNGTPAERLAAIKKAQAWWTAERKAKYSFDYIEKEMVSGDPQASRPKR